MKRFLAFAVVVLALGPAAGRVLALSESLSRPSIFFPKGFETNRAERFLSVLRSDKFKFLDGMTSYWEPKWATTLAYEGDSLNLTAMLSALGQIEGFDVRLTFSQDLSREARGVVAAGSWWVTYSHTAPDTITVRINLAAPALGREQFELRLPRTKS